MAAQPPILYGVPFSQPVRAVMWLMIYKGLPFELVLINPGSRGERGSRGQFYLAKNPGGTIPCLEEPDTGFVLGEAHAIMCYLARKHEWHDLYPQDAQQRAAVDWYLHWHHRSVREASGGLVEASLIDLRAATYSDIPSLRREVREIAKPGSLVFLMEMKDSVSGRVLARAADTSRNPNIGSDELDASEWAAVETAAAHWAGLFRQFLDQNLGT